MSSERVDVLAVLDAAHRATDPQRASARHDIAQARAAVAELIEAVSEVVPPHLSDVDLFQRLPRLRAALARIGEPT